MKITVFYVGSSLPAPLTRAERDLNEKHKLGLELALHNCGSSLSEKAWSEAARDVPSSEIVFIIHVTDQDNASRLVDAIASHPSITVIAINCMPELMRRTRMGKLDFSALMKSRGDDESTPAGVMRRLGTWMAETMRARKGSSSSKKKAPGGVAKYSKLIQRLPAILKLVPRAGKLGDIKNYILLYSYFLQPTPNNIRSMILFAIKHYVPGQDRLRVRPPETKPSEGIYHPDADDLFESLPLYRKWYEGRGRKLRPTNTVGLLLMRPQIISNSRRHYDRLIRAIEDEGLSVIPALSTFMDNRDACRSYFVSADKPLVSQVVSLTGFSFVGGPASNDSDAAVEFLKEMNAPLRSMVSLDTQTIESWEAGRLGLNPVQSAMQVAIPEIDGATEPFVYGGMTSAASEPIPLEDRCTRIARRLSRWNRLQTESRESLRIALVIFCFPPGKGNIGTAADLDVFPSLIEILGQLQRDGYRVDVPSSADALREMVLEGFDDGANSVAHIAYRMNVDEYRSLCPYVENIEAEWGPAPGRINSNGREILIQGIELGNVFIAVQPTFGYEGDPMRLLNAESGAPHHGFMGLYTYLEKGWKADAVIHVGTHGSLEFMPGKQVGLSSGCWPDRLIGELPNIYIYSVNNPSEGTIARRRSYAELISYLTPPVENAGLYRGLAELKEMLNAYRQSVNEHDRIQLFDAIQEQAAVLNL